jgi:pimeloyl-ACP methyl ester carboxylesterase
MRLASRSAGTGPAVVWLHGYTMDSSLWDELWSLLPGFQHVGLDLPGHGGSDPLPAGTSLPEVAAAVADEARASGADRLVALSFGTTVALQVAIEHPDVAARVVLAAPAIGGAPEEAGTRERYLQLLALHRMRASGADLAGAWMQSPPDIFRGTEAHPPLHDAIRAVVTRHRWAELGDATMRSLVRHVQTDGELASIRGALTVLFGAHDLPSVRTNVERLRSAAPRCTVHEIAGTGHLCLLERPDLAAPIVAAQLGG